MNLDKLDIFIIQEFSKTFDPDSEYINPTDIKWDISKDFVKKFLPDLDESDKLFKREVQNVYKKIIYKLDIFCELGVFSKKRSFGKNGKTVYDYVLDLDKIKLGKHKFSDGFCKCLIVRLTPKIS